MTTLMQPLREEHKELLPHIEQLRIIANSVGESPLNQLRLDIAEVYEFLAYHLIPHAEAEDAALYPVVASVMGAANATATMKRDHVEVAALTDELASLRFHLTENEVSASVYKELRRVLYGLYTLVKVHFAKEEEIYLPLLEKALKPDEAHALFAAMEKAAHEAKAHPIH